MSEVKKGEGQPCGGVNRHDDGGKDELAGVRGAL